MTTDTPKQTAEIIDMAREQYETSDVQILDIATINPAEGGVWVDARLWVAGVTIATTQTKAPTMPRMWTVEGRRSSTFLEKSSTQIYAYTEADALGSTSKLDQKCHVIWRTSDITSKGDTTFSVCADGGDH